MKKLTDLRLLLMLILIVTAYTGLYAQFAGGSGTEADPYLIQTAAQLDSVRYFLTSSFRQIADIDLGIAPYNTNLGWQPIGSYLSPAEDHRFTGSYDGDNHTISSLFINKPSTEYQGLFGYAENATIRNIHLYNINIRGAYYSGGLIGYSVTNNLYNCSTSGIIISSFQSIGGLIGYVFWSVINSCYSSVYVYASSYAGGLVGEQTGLSTYLRCFTTGNVYGSSHSGGLIGVAQYVEVSNCFATGDITGSYVIGGLIGMLFFDSTVSLSYSTGHISPNATYGGGLIGDNYYQNPVLYSYWNIETSGYETSDGGQGCTTSEMTFPYSSQMYYGFNFNGMWRHDTSGIVNNGYPYLSLVMELDTLSLPLIFPQQHYFSEPIQVHMTAPEPYSVIYYTTDGSEPSNQSFVYYSPITVQDSITIKARSYRLGWYPSNVASATYEYGTGLNQDVQSNSDAYIFVKPNPFSIDATITFYLPKGGYVYSAINNAKGQLVRTLTDGQYAKGEHTLTWDGKTDTGQHVSNGIYFYQLKGTDFRISKKLMLMKQ
jgi:hypothetical protein